MDKNRDARIHVAHRLDVRAWIVRGTRVNLLLIGFERDADARRRPFGIVGLVLLVNDLAVLGALHQPFDRRVQIRTQACWLVHVLAVRVSDKYGQRVGVFADVRFCPRADHGRQARVLVKLNVPVGTIRVGAAVRSDGLGQHGRRSHRSSHSVRDGDELGDVPRASVRLVGKGHLMAPILGDFPIGTVRSGSAHFSGTVPPQVRIPVLERAIVVIQPTVYGLQRDLLAGLVAVNLLELRTHIRTHVGQRVDCTDGNHRRDQSGADEQDDENLPLPSVLQRLLPSGEFYLVLAFLLVGEQVGLIVRILPRLLLSYRLIAVLVFLVSEHSPAPNPFFV